MNEDSCMDICQNDESMEAKLTCLCHELDLALKWKRPSLLFAIYDSEEVRHFAQDSLEAHIKQGSQKVIHYQVEFQKKIDLVQFIKDISEKTRDVVFIQSSNTVENITQTANLISIVNSCRGALVDNLVRVVFWLTENEALKVAHLAPDFWASRHRVFEFINFQANGYGSAVKRVFLTNKTLPEQPMDVSMPLSEADLQVESPLVIDFSEDDEPAFSGINMLLMLGVANWKEGNQERALEPLSSALALAQKSGNSAHQTMCHKAIALVHSEAGRTQEAIRSYQQVIELGAENVTIWNNLGLLFLKSGQLDEALKAFTSALNVNPNDPVSWYGLGNIHSGSGHLDEAINCYRKAIKFNASYVGPWIRLADVLNKLARVDDALYAYMRIVEMDNKNVRAWSEIGSIYFKAGSYKQSIDAYKKALLLGEGSPILHKNLAYAHTQVGNYDEAIPLLLKAIELESDEIEKSLLCNMVGDVYRRIGDYDNAVASYEMADRHTPISNLEVPAISGPEDQQIGGLNTRHFISDSHDPVENVKPGENQPLKESLMGSRVHENILVHEPVESLGNAGSLPEVTGLETPPSNLENADLLGRLANLFLKAGAVDKAIENYEKSVALDPSNAKTTFELGLLYSQKNELPKAIKLLKLSANLFSSDGEKAEALNLAGDLYRNLKEYANALECFGAAYGYDPKNEKVMDNLEKIQGDLDQLIHAGSNVNNFQPSGGFGSALETSKKPVESKIIQNNAAENSEPQDQAIKIDLANPDVWNELGNIYARSNAVDEAIEAYQKAITLNPEFGWSYSNLALVYAFRGRREEAVSLLEKSIDLLWTDKDKAVVWNRIGDILRQDGKYAKAVAAYQNADRLNQAQLSVSNVHEVNFEHLFSHFLS